MDKKRRKIGMIVAVVVAISAGTAVTHRRAAQPPAAVPAAASAPAAGTAAPAEQAVTALLALPELKAWSGWIEKKSGGTAHGAVVADAGGARIINGRSYQAYSFVENDAESAHFWQGFYVTPAGDSILVEDAATGDLVSVDEWRQKDKPLERLKEH